MMQNKIVKINNVSKSFPGILANDNVNFEINKNSVHALLGENGAGKSTIVKFYMECWNQIKVKLFLIQTSF